MFRTWTSTFPSPHRWFARLDTRLPSYINVRIYSLYPIRKNNRHTGTNRIFSEVPLSWNISFDIFFKHTAKDLYPKQIYSLSFFNDITICKACLVTICKLWSSFSTNEVFLNVYFLAKWKVWLIYCQVCRDCEHLPRLFSDSISCSRVRHMFTNSSLPCAFFYQLVPILRTLVES